MPSTVVIGVFGPKGSGKSLLAALLARRQHRMSGGRRKILYFPETFNHADGEPITLEEMFTGSERMNDAIIIWDETQVLLNKFRAMTHANRSLLGFLQQIRKRGCHLYYTSNAPKQLDKALGEQTDWHCYADFYEDRRCRKYDQHLADCRDSITVSWVDTQGKLGVDSRYRDGRFRNLQRVRGLVQHYGKLYNTFAAVSVEEVAKMDAGAIKRAHDEKAAQVTVKDFAEMMRGWIANMILTSEVTPKYLIPGTFAKQIAEETKGEITPSATMVGMACSDLGLKRIRGKQANRYELPAKSDVQSGLWQAGLA